MDKSALNYRPAYVYRKRDFFRIIFYWRESYDKPLERFKPTFDLNRIKDLSIREKSAKVMSESVTELLKNGWNPLTGDMPKATNTGNIESRSGIDKSEITLHTAMKDANRSILKRSNKKRTHSSYKSHLKLLSEYLTKAGKININPSLFSPFDAESYAEYLLEKKYAPKTINTKLDYVSGLFDWMEGKTIVEKNPFAHVQRAKEIDQSSEEDLFTPKEIETMKKHLLNVFPELWQYFLFIYYCTMRPDSVMAIKLADINIKDNILYVYPENHKNGKPAKKKLLGAHLKYLIPYLNSIKEKGTDYLFSDKMKPGPIRKPGTRAAELWRIHVKDQLGIKKDAYQGKHTFGTEYTDLNTGSEDLKWLQNQMSHADLQTTSIYLKKRKKVNLNEGESHIPEI